jgi:hypothetical protein
MVRRDRPQGTEVKRLILIAAVSAATAAFGKEPEQPESQATQSNVPHAAGKPVTTTKIRRCPEGYEVIYRADGRERGCAKDIVPTND